MLIWLVRMVCCVLAIASIFGVLLDCFEAVVLPRRVTRPYRYARLFYRNTWIVWRWVALQLAMGRRRETFLSVFGPLSLLALFVSWAVVLIFGFGLLQWSLQLPLQGVDGLG